MYLVVVAVRLLLNVLSICRYAVFRALIVPRISGFSKKVLVAFFNNVSTICSVPRVGKFQKFVSRVECSKGAKKELLMFIYFVPGKANFKKNINIMRFQA